MSGRTPPRCSCGCGQLRRWATAACADAERTRGVAWLEPRLQAEISYLEMMQGRLRDLVCGRSCYQAERDGQHLPLVPPVPLLPPDRPRAFFRAYLRQSSVRSQVAFAVWARGGPMTSRLQTSRPYATSSLGQRSPRNR